jgi:hypothetical protein
MKIFGMPLAIIAFFAIGLAISWIPNGPIPVAAFFLAVGLTCLTYSYLGGHLEQGNAASGTFGVLSFKLGGSIATFLVAWLFLNHHLALSGKESSQKVSLKTGDENIRVEAGTRQLGQLEGKDLESWVLELAEEDYFHPALILARRPFCSDFPGKCVLNAGFRASASKSSKVPQGIMKLCVIGKTSGDIVENLQHPSLQPLLANVEVISLMQNESQGATLKMKASYASGGGVSERCRNIATPHAGDISPAIRIGALMNPADLDQLFPDRDLNKPRTYEVKVLF